nr:hypothetical protein GCM10020093_067250 [Planobispora longispora]
MPVGRHGQPGGILPDQNRIREKLLREDLFTVVMEQFPTDTADYADIVLPATMQIENTDLHAGYGHMYLMWNEPAVEPPGECLSTTETFRRLARHMGLTEPSLFDSDLELAEQLLSSGHPSLDGITVDRLRKEGWVRLNVPQPFAPFADGGFPTPRAACASPGVRLHPSHTASAPGGPYPLALVTPAPTPSSTRPSATIPSCDAAPRGRGSWSTRPTPRTGA